MELFWVKREQVPIAEGAEAPVKGSHWEYLLQWQISGLHLEPLDPPLLGM